MRTPLSTGLMILSVLFAISTRTMAQNSELSFTTYTLESGVAGEDGAVYRFSNVTTGVDALLTILSRSSADLVLESVDTSGAGMGYGSALQPVLGFPGTAPANTTWSMSFRLTFCKAGSTEKINVDHFFVTGLDIDGDSHTLNEWAEMKQVSSVDTSLVNNLLVSCTKTDVVGDDFLVEGIVLTAPGIDTSALNVMASYEFIDKEEIEFTLGARTGSATTSAGVRLNSLWFRDFFNPILPVSMTAFTANLTREHNALLNWTTSTELNASHFVVEKSLDGKTFTSIGQVAAHGNSFMTQHYSFTESLNKHITGMVYYRLRAVDFDGRTELSKTRIISLKQSSSNTPAISAYPNPVKGALQLTMPASWQQKQLEVNVYSLNGHLVKKIATASASQTEEIDLSNLTSGYYVVYANCEGESAMQKVLKN